MDGFLKKSRKWKIQVTFVISFLSSNDRDTKLTVYPKTTNTKTMVDIKRFNIVRVIRKLNGSIIIRFHDGLEELINDSDFDIFVGTCSKFHKIVWNRKVKK